MEPDSAAATRAMAAWISHSYVESVSSGARVWARHALLDWVAVTIAGSREPAADILASEYAGDTRAPCSLVARGQKARAADAALINGTAGHALDFDDASSRMLGHPSAPVVPAALAIAEVHRVSGLALLDAIVAGHEVASAVGDLVLPEHYSHGFHSTGTLGSLGAAAAAARLAGLDARRTGYALGLAATQAAGLKCMFGTMAKPFHAGRAAMNGVMAVQMAARGFTAAVDAIECEQGFVRTLGALGHDAVLRELNLATPRLAIESTLFKYHAACYFTHAAIEAVTRLRLHVGLDPQNMASMTVTVHPSLRGVCDIAEPRTGLELKFSIQHLVILALSAMDTADPGLYTEATARAAPMVEARRKVRMHFTDAIGRDEAEVVIETRSGERYSQSANVAVPAEDLALQWRRLVAKGSAITQPVIGAARFDALVEAIEALEAAPSIERLSAAIRLDPSIDCIRDGVRCMR